MFLAFQLIEAKCIQLFSSSLTGTSFNFRLMSRITQQTDFKEPKFFLHMLLYHNRIAMHRHEPSNVGKKTKQFAV